MTLAMSSLCHTALSSPLFLSGLDLLIQHLFPAPIYKSSLQFLHLEPRASISMSLPARAEMLWTEKLRVGNPRWLLSAPPKPCLQEHAIVCGPSGCHRANRHEQCRGQVPAASQVPLHPGVEGPYHHLVMDYCPLKSCQKGLLHSCRSASCVSLGR